MATVATPITPDANIVSVAEDATVNPVSEPQRGWWHSATREDCLIAEENMIKGFIDLKRISYESRDITIDFDSKPQSVKDKEKKKSESSLMNLFNWGQSGTVGSCGSSEMKRETDTENETDSKKTKIETENTNENNNNNNNGSDKSTTKSETKHSKCNSNKTTNKTTKPTEFIHTLSLKLINNNNNGNIDEKKDEPQPEEVHIVMAHGYGCGGGIFVPCVNHVFDELIDQLGSDFVMNHVNIHLIDWLGCGLSSKPKFLCADTDETEVFFIESLEKWREKMGIEKFILVGHSVGGYCSAVYSLKYGQYVSHLILLSPAGIPELPPNTERESEIKELYPWKAKILFGFIKDNNITPFDIVRMAGPKGKPWVHKLVAGRFARTRLNGTEFVKKLAPLLADYLYQISHSNGSGEYCLNKILTWHAYGVKGLYSRLNKLMDYGMKVDFMYGERDWMDSSAAYNLKKDKLIECNIYEIEEAGHQLTVENKEIFAKTFARVIKDGQK